MDTKAHDALVALLQGMFGNDAYLNDDTKPGGADCPTGDDYNVLFDLVLDAAAAAGIDATVLKRAADKAQCPNQEG